MAKSQSSTSSDDNVPITHRLQLKSAQSTQKIHKPACSRLLNPDGSDDDQQSPYELQREANIRRNNKFLITLGLTTTSPEIFLLVGKQQTVGRSRQLKDRKLDHPRRNPPRAITRPSTHDQSEQPKLRKRARRGEGSAQHRGSSEDDGSGSDDESDDSRSNIMYFHSIAAVHREKAERNGLLGRNCEAREGGGWFEGLRRRHKKVKIPLQDDSDDAGSNGVVLGSTEQPI